MDQYIQQLWTLLQSPEVLVAICLGMAAIIMAFKVPALRWGLVALVMFTGSLYRETGKEAWTQFPNQEPPPPLVFPLHQIQENGRPLTVLLLIGGAILVFCGRHQPIALPGWLLALLAVEAVLIIKLFVSEFTSYALLSIIVYVLTLILFGIGVPRWIREDGSIIWAFRSLGMAAAFFVLANLFQAAINPAPLMAGGRFRGTTGNAQAAGLLLGLSAAVLPYLGLNRSIARIERCFWLAAMVATIVLLLWTGSRTAALMAAVSILILFRRRLTTMMSFIGVFALLIGFLVYRYFDVDVGRLARVDDTRTMVWYGMWRGFEENPIFGMPQDRSFGRLGLGENAWLAMACTCGLIGLAPLLLLGGYILGYLNKLRMIARFMPTVPCAHDAIIAGLCALLIGSVFEATFLGVISFNVPFLYIAMAIADRLFFERKLSVLTSASDIYRTTQVRR